MFCFVLVLELEINSSFVSEDKSARPAQKHKTIYFTKEFVFILNRKVLTHFKSHGRMEMSTKYSLDLQRNNLKKEKSD